MQRVLLFLATNLAVVLSLSVVGHMLGVNRFLDARGLDFGALLGFAALFGFGGAFLSLAIAKWSAKMAVGARVITEPADAREVWLVETVAHHARNVGISMPEVAIYAAEEINAFATGMRRDSALVAVSSGLLHRMSGEEADAVVAHEISHIANGDMVTLALIQGVLNTFVIFVSRVVGWFVDRVVLRNEEGPGVGYYVTFFVLEIGLGILAYTVVMYFSRQREFRADAGAADLAGRQRMIAALERLRHAHGELPSQVAALGIAGGCRDGWQRWFASHPPLAERIAALRANANTSARMTARHAAAG